MKTIFATAAAASLLAAPAFAGALIFEPAPEPQVVAAPAPAPEPMLPNWTGFYAGGQVGWAQGEVDADVDGLSFDADDDSYFFGAHAGYDYDFGNGFVLGAEAAYDRHDLSFSSGGFEAEIDNVARLTARGGYSFGNTLAYLKGGAAWVDGEAGFAGETDSASDWGWVAGAGVERRVTERVSAGVEYLYHQVDDFEEDGVDVNAHTVGARISLRF